MVQHFLNPNEFKIFGFNSRQNVSIFWPDRYIFAIQKLEKGDCTSTVTSSGEFEFDKTWEECNLSPTMDGNDIKERFLIPDHKLQLINITHNYGSNNFKKILKVFSNSRWK